MRVLTASLFALLCVALSHKQVSAVPPDPKDFLKPEQLVAARQSYVQQMRESSFPMLTPFFQPGVARFKFKKFIHRLKTHMENKLFPAEDLKAWRRKASRGLRLGDNFPASAEPHHPKWDFLPPITDLQLAHAKHASNLLGRNEGLIRQEVENTTTTSTTIPTSSSDPPAPTTAPPMSATTCAVHALAYINAVQLFLADPQLVPGTDHFWALEMLDATGKWPDGMLVGNLVSLGSFDECLAVRADFAGDELVVGVGAEAGISMDMFPVDKQFKGKYCTAQIDLRALAAGDAMDNPLVGAIGEENFELLVAGGVNPAVAVCMPSSCSAEELKAAMDSAAADMGLTFVVDDRGCAVDEPTIYTGADYAMMAVLVVIVVLVFVGTLIDVRMQAAKKAAVAAAKKGGEDKPAGSDAGLKALQDDLSVQFLTSFSAYSNGKKILNTDTSSPDNIGCMHGLRFISMTWVILAHTYAFGGTNPWVNLANGLPKFLREWPFTAVANASTAVDTFFLLSGLLVSYVVIKELKKAKGRLRPNPGSWLGMYYFVRYIRLTPAFAMGIGLVATLVRYVGEGPLWGSMIANSNLCRHDWWKYLLYVHNYVKPTVEFEDQITCFPQSWYLACDMQLFLVSPLFIFPMFYLPKFAYAWIGTLVVASVAPGLTIMIQNEDYPPTLMPNNNPIQNFYDVYANTYVRAGPYLMGIAVGYFLQQKERGSVKFPKALVVGGWVIATGVALAVVYGLSDYFPYESARPSHTEAVIYSAFSRIAWALVVAWVILACHYGYGGPVDAFLSWKPFMPLGRLTYSSYLLSIYVQLIFQYSRKDVQYNDHPTMIYWFLGTLTLTTAGAFVFCLLFESPLMGIVKIITTGLKGQPRQRPPRPNENGVANRQNGINHDDKPGPSEPKIIHNKTIPEDIIISTTEKATTRF